MSMVRKQVYITPEQERLLKRCASERAKTEAELIREGLDVILSEEKAEEALRSAAWAEELAFMEERARIKVPPGPRGWTREELYEERLDELAARRHKHSRLSVRPEGPGEAGSGEGSPGPD